LKRSTPDFSIVIDTYVGKPLNPSFSNVKNVENTWRKRVTVLNERSAISSYEVIHKFTPLMMEGVKI
jgi:hypothetical protein